MTMIDKDAREERRREQAEGAHKLAESGVLDDLFAQIDAGEIELEGSGGLIQQLIKTGLERGSWVLVMVATLTRMESVAMARRGRKRNLERERLYWDLLASGHGTVDACREVGIGRRTGLRWRLGTVDFGATSERPRQPRAFISRCSSASGFRR